MTTKARSTAALFQLSAPPPALLGERRASADVTDPGPTGRREGRSERRREPTSAGRGDERLPDVAYLVLGHVATSPGGVHGYQLGQQLSRSTLQLPSMRLGQLYRILRRLERAALVVCHVESESSRLRYRFTVTPRGESVLQEWLTTLPRASGAVCQQLLYRLRFADRLPVAAILRLVDDAGDDLRTTIERLTKGTANNRDRRGDSHPYDHALKARLAMDRCWLEEVRGLVERSAATAQPHTAG